MNRRIAYCIGALLGALALVVTPSCALDAPKEAGAEGPSADEGSPGAYLWAASWSLTWDTTRLDPARGGGWSVKTDMGYAVRLKYGWLVDHSVSFGPCDTGGASAGVGGSSALRLFGLGIREARAHDDADPSAIEAMYAEDLLHPEPAGPWPMTFEAKRYCRAHWLIARATAKLSAPPSVAPLLDGRSLYLAGTWERGGARRAFTVDTWWPAGHLRDLDEVLDPSALAAARADGGAYAARVTVKRDLGAMFDGIDFETASEEVITGLTVENLAARAELKVELFRPEE